MDINTLCRRIAEVRGTSKMDAAKAAGMESALYRDLLRSIADKEINDPAGFAIIALETQNYDLPRGAE